MNCHGRIQRIAPKGFPVLPPPGDSREQWRTLLDLAGMLGQRLDWQKPPQIFDALAKVNDHEPHLIFCDILMPRLDGYQTCAIIKRNPKFAQVPVIMLSSKDGLFDKARGRMVGSEDYLTKPFTKDQLLQAVEQYSSRVA